MIDETADELIGDVHLKHQLLKEMQHSAHVTREVINHREVEDLID